MQAQATAPTVVNPVKPALGQTFIRHPLANAALKDLDTLFKMPPSAEHGWCGLLIGPTGAGKSAVLRAFCSKHKPSNDPGLVQPVVSVELPDKCNTRTLSEVLLRAQKHPAAGRQMSIPELQTAAIAHLQRQRTKCIIFDEAQHAIRGDT
jgi:hypothetical protein